VTTAPAADEAGGGAAAESAAATPPDRCGARQRGGGTCARSPEPGKRRCRRHGGAPGNGAPAGNRNALKDGLYTREAIADQREVTEIIREGRRLIRELEGKAVTTSHRLRSELQRVRLLKERP
jgi:glucans biosynthesis protein